MDEWIEGLYRQRQGKARADQPAIITTGNPVEDLRALLSRLRGDGSITQAELLASLDHAIELLAGKHPETFDPLKDIC